MDNRTDEQLAERLWNYNRLGMSLEPADVIIVLCSHDIQVADRAVSLGIPRGKIWIENRSTNTGENVSFTRRLPTLSDQVIRKAIVVQKPSYGAESLCNLQGSMARAGSHRYIAANTFL